MSDMGSSDLRKTDEARGYFRSLLGLQYSMAFWSYLWMVPPVAASRREWLWLAAALLLAALCGFRPSLRFLWRHADWFRVATVILVVDSAAFTLAALWSRSQTLLLVPFATTFVIIAVAAPAMKKFAGHHGLPDRG